MFSVVPGVLDGGSLLSGVIKSSVPAALQRIAMPSIVSLASPKTSEVLS